MAKPKAYPVEKPDRQMHCEKHVRRLQEPHTGSKTMKNAKHSHDKQGEGS